MGLACNIACPATDAATGVPCSGHGSCQGVDLAGLNSSRGRGTCGGGCFQAAPGAVAQCNCQSGLPGVVSGYSGTGCETPVYSKLLRVSSASVREPHVRIALRVKGRSVATFSSAEQTVFTKGAAVALQIFPERVLVESLQDVQTATLVTSGATTFMANSSFRKLLQQAVAVSEVVVTLRVKVENNEGTGKLAEDLEKIVTDGVLTKRIDELGLKGIEITTEGLATQFQSVTSIIFKNPDFLVALIPAGLVLVLAGLVGLCTQATKYLQHRNETKARMNKNIAQLSLAPGPGPMQVCRACVRSRCRSARFSSPRSCLITRAQACKEIRGRGCWTGRQDGDAS